LIADAFHLPQFGIEEASEDSALALLLQDECIKHVVKVFDLRAKVFVLERLLQSVDHFLIQTGFVGFRRDIAHGDEQSAQADAAWLAKNFDLPIRSAAS
jgi:hypothetical protein